MKKTAINSGNVATQPENKKILKSALAKEALDKIKVRVIEILGETTVGKDLNATIDEFIKKEKRSEEKRNKAEEIRQIADLEVLAGGKHNKRVKTEFKKDYESLKYSKLTQEKIIGLVDLDNIDLIIKILKEKYFTSIRDLIAKIDDDGKLMKLLATFKSDLKKTVEIIIKVKSLDLKIEILKKIVGLVERIKDEEQKANKLDEWEYKYIKQIVIDAIMDTKGEIGKINGENLKTKEDVFRFLISKGYLLASDFKDYYTQIESDDFLISLAISNSKLEEASKILRFIGDTTILVTVVSNNASDFTKLDDDGRKSIARYAKLYIEAIGNKPKIMEIDSLVDGDENKFVIGVNSDSEGKGKFFIGWSNQKTCEYHRDIFSRIERYSGIKFEKVLKCGGMIDVTREDSKIKVMFFGYSSDFGHYNKKTFELFEEELLAELKKAFGSDDVTIEIRES